MQVVHLGFAPDYVPYLDAWAEQRRRHAARVAGEVPDAVLLMEHEPVYTAGRRTTRADRPVTDPGAPVVEVDRGGRITWHGPGQITGYPIVALPDPLDVVAYVRRLEDLMAAVCAGFGVATTRVDGRTGVWVPGDDGPDRKIGAIGVRVAQRVTMHGFALNCDCDLGWFDRIVPCGISDATVTSLSRELSRPVPVDEVLPMVEANLDLVVTGSPALVG